MTNILTAVMEAVGVKEGEEFKLAGIMHAFYKFKDGELLMKTSPTAKWETSVMVLNVFLQSEIILLPYSPERGDTFYTYGGLVPLGIDVVEVKWHGSVSDYMAKAMGCCFRTEEEARKALPIKYEIIVGKQWQS